MEPNQSSQPDAPTATAPTTPALAGRMTSEDFRQVTNARRSNCSARADGYLAIMLINRAGWSLAQTAEFLGLPLETVGAWEASWNGAGFAGLHYLRDPQYAAD